MCRIAERNYDIFIAYHGTYDSNGSCSKAEQLCDFLESKGYSVFFFPRYPGDAYKANYLAVMQSKTFLLVCNDHIARDEDGKINKVEHYDLSYEIDAFYALTQTQHDVSVQDAKVLMYGNDPLGAEAELHELFANRPHFRAVKEKDDDIFHEVYDWLKNRLPAMYLIDSFNRRHTGIWYSREYFEHHIEFEFFSNQLRAISDHSNDYNPNIAIQRENVHIFTKEQISGSLKQQYRQYLTGSRLFERGNIKNKFSYLETGISYYKNFKVDTPHYHETTAEHYILLQGEQKILDLGSGKQYIARKGDFVFIPPWTKHFTKNKAGTKIFFAKAPDGKDKVEIYELPEKNHVDYDEWEKSYEVDFRNSDK